MMRYCKFMLCVIYLFDVCMNVKSEKKTTFSEEKQLYKILPVSI